MADSRGLVHVRHVIIAAAACLAVTIIIIIIRPQRQQLAKFVCQKEGHHEVVPACVGRGQGGRLEEGRGRVRNLCVPEKQAGLQPSAVWL